MDRLTSSSLELPGELWHDDGGSLAWGVAGSIIENEVGSGDADRGLRTPSTDVCGIANSAFAVDRNVLRGIAYMVHTRYRLTNYSNCTVNKTTAIAYTQNDHVSSGRQSPWPTGTAPCSVDMDSRGLACVWYRCVQFRSSRNADRPRRHDSPTNLHTTLRRDLCGHCRLRRHFQKLHEFIASFM